MSRVLAAIGAAIFFLIAFALVAACVFAVFVMPFFGVYEPLLGAVGAAVIFFAAWGLVETVGR